MYKIQEIAYNETRYVNVSSKRVGKTGIVRRDWGEQEGEESRGGVQSLDREGRGGGANDSVAEQCISSLERGRGS